MTTHKNNTLRRTFLKTTAAASVAVGMGTVTAQDDDGNPDIELGGQIAGWEGVSPSEIDGETNPTLELATGEEYVVEWENLDGAAHNFVIEDEDGANLVESPLITSGSQTVEFEATDEMDEYYCAPHAGSMRGAIEIVGEEEEDVDEEEEAEEEDVDEEEDAVGVDTIVEIPDERTPENLAIDDDGALYFSIVAGEIRRLTPEQTQETEVSIDDVEQICDLPGEAYGVEITPDETLYVALHAEDQTGIWRVHQETVEEDDDVDDEAVEADEEEEEAAGPGDPGDDSEDEDADAEDEDTETEDEDAETEDEDAETEDADELNGEAEPFAIVGVQDEVFPNGIQYDPEQERLLFTESFGGAVYEVPLDADDPEDAASVFFEDERLATEVFGANGLTISQDNDLFVAVTADEVDGEAVGRIVRVPIEDDGTAGEAETYFEGPEIHGADGIEMHPEEGDLYVAAILEDEVARISEDLEAETVLSADDGLTAPSDVTFGTADEQDDDLFICNFAPEEPAESAILRWSPTDEADAADEDETDE